MKYINKSIKEGQKVVNYIQLECEHYLDKNVSVPANNIKNINKVGRETDLEVTVKRKITLSLKIVAQTSLQN
jgi:hypothetical protein